MSHFREDKSITPYTLKSNVQTHKVIFLDLLQPYTLKCLSNVHLYQCEGSTRLPNGLPNGKIRNLWSRVSPIMEY